MTLRQHALLRTYVHVYCIFRYARMDMQTACFVTHVWTYKLLISLRMYENANCLFRYARNDNLMACFTMLSKRGFRQKKSSQTVYSPTTVQELSHRQQTGSPKKLSS